MSPTAPAATARDDVALDGPEDAPASRFERLVEGYRADHRHPVNHVLHVGVGWPIMALAVILAPFRPAWSLGLFVLSYAIMWFGHFAFEGNLPTIFKKPTIPFVIAWAVIRGGWRWLAGRVARANP